jgi:hypothetical protein
MASSSLVCFLESKVIVEITGTIGQLADILTKPLGRVRFQERDKIDIVKIKQSNRV